LAGHTKKEGRELQKVFDILAFFSTAYSNVSSYIYYYALKLTRPPLQT
jgi:hypothetical protein